MSLDDMTFAAPQRTGSDEQIYGAFGADWFAEQLPGVLAGDPFMQRFLRIFQDVADTVRWPIEHLDQYVSPALAPPELLEWLARWIDLDIDTTWDEIRQREFIRDAAPLFRYRGTLRGLRAFLELAIGSAIEVVDSGQVVAFEQWPHARAKESSRTIRRRVAVRVSRRDLIANSRRGRIEDDGQRSVIPHGKYDQRELERVISQLIPADTVLKMHYYDAL